MQTSLIGACLQVHATATDCHLTYLGIPVTKVPGVYTAKEGASAKEKARCKFHNRLSGIELLCRMSRERTRQNVVCEEYYKNIERGLKQTV